jgi:hypothetical protein
VDYEFHTMHKNFIVIPGLFAALPRTAPGIQRLCFRQKDTGFRVPSPAAPTMAPE